MLWHTVIERLESELGSFEKGIWQCGTESSLKMLLFPLRCLWMCFSLITHEALWNPFKHSDIHDNSCLPSNIHFQPLNSDIVDNSCLTHSHSFPTFNQRRSISHQTWCAPLCLLACSVFIQRYKVICRTLKNRTWMFCVFGSWFWMNNCLGAAICVGSLNRIIAVLPVC